MTNTPGNGWPGAPPPQGPGGTPPWGAQSWPPGAATPQAPPQPTGGQSYPGQPYPGQPYPGQAPGNPPQHGQPYPPSDEQGTPGFDPRQALGAQLPASVSINQFAPPPNRTPLLITLAALITLVLVIGGGIYVRSLPAAEPSASPSPSQTAAAGPGHPFNTPDERQRGRWEILDSTWTDEGLELQLRIYSDTGTISFTFMAFSNASTEVVTPTTSPRSPDIRKGIAYVSEPVTGYVFFPMPRGDATIILATGTGRQMSALTVKG